MWPQVPSFHRRLLLSAGHGAARILDSVGRAHRMVSPHAAGTMGALLGRVGGTSLN